MDPRDQLRRNMSARLESNGIHLPDSTINQCVDEAYKLWPKRRSDAQNRYIWAVVVKVISEHSGKKPDAVYEDIKLMFNPKLIERIDGTSMWVGGSLAKENTRKFAEIIEKVQIWAATKGWYIPDPNEEEMISAELEKQNEKA